MSSRVVATYDSEEVILIIGGLQVTGFGSDSKVTLSRAGNINEAQVGVDGEVTVNHMRNKVGTLTINLKAHSDWDNALDELQAVAESIGIHAVPILLYIPSANKELVTEAWLETQPDINAGTQVDDRAWVFGVANANPSLIESVANIATALEGISL